MCDAPVSTRASHVSDRGTPAAFSIVTVVTILPTSVSFVRIQVTILLNKVPASAVCQQNRFMKEVLRHVRQTSVCRFGYKVGGLTAAGLWFYFVQTILSVSQIVTRLVKNRRV